MAVAYLDPAAGLLPVSSPTRSEDLPTGSWDPLVRGSRRHRRIDLLSIAEGFAVSAPAIPELQEITERSWVLLAVSDLFEAWAIGWPPGGRIELHDHGRSSGTVVVARGCLTETSLRSTDSGVPHIATHHVAAGEHRRFGPGYIHDLLNEGDGPAISVHVYSPKLATMAYYEMGPADRVRLVRTEDVPPVGPFDVTSDHDPS
ncbi:MAG: cysteine dioxygenase family protein [Acidimicrobiales bacterium]|jgi:hypothetical protein